MGSFRNSIKSTPEHTHPERIAIFRLIMGNFNKAVFGRGFCLHLLVLVLWFCGASTSGDEEQAKVLTIDVNEARDHLQKGTHTYLDVRTEEEFRKGHLKNSFNIPYLIDTSQGMVKNTKFMYQVMSHYSKEDHLVVGCRSGVRSVYAAGDLLNAEFKHVYNMGGGYIAWTETGFAVEKPNNIIKNDEL